MIKHLFSKKTGKIIIKNRVLRTLGLLCGVFLIFIIVFLFICYGIGFNQNVIQEKEVRFTPEEVESMLFLYNQTTIKGTDVEVIAPLGIKLSAGLKEARTQQDSTKSIVLKLNINEIGICYNIIQSSSFEAKYAILLLGMKQKLEKLLPRVIITEEEKQNKNKK